MADIEWIDTDLSAKLPALRREGEGPHLEFVESFPDQARELAKEIAAFATSGGGLILLGVSDCGDPIGLADADAPEARDGLITRIEGICAGTVRPAITPRVRFGRDAGRVILGVEVPDGEQPVYYCNHTPYVRHLRASRPAEPHEVVERVREWTALETSSAPAPLADFGARLAYTVCSLIAHSDEVDDRMLNPAFDQMRLHFQNSAASLRSIASSGLADREGVRETLFDLSAAADKVAFYRLAISGESFEGYKAAVSRVRELALHVRATLLSRLPRTGAQLRAAVADLRAQQYSLRDMAARVDEVAEDRGLGAAQFNASNLGHRLLQLACFGLDELDEGLVGELKGIGRDLHLLNAKNPYEAGLQSAEEMMNTIRQAASRLEKLVEAVSAAVRDDRLAAG